MDNRDVLKVQIENLIGVVGGLQDTLKDLNKCISALDTRLSVLEATQNSKRAGVVSFITWSIMAAAVLVAYFK